VGGAGIALLAASALVAVYLVHDWLVLALTIAPLSLAAGIGAAWARVRPFRPRDDERCEPPDDVADWQRRRDAEIRKLYPHI
jgi:hypothetical protein